MTLQPNGKILVAGSAYNDEDTRDFVLARYEIGGQLDGSFGHDGVVTTDFYGDFDEALAMALQPDGAILLAGYAEKPADDDFALARYTSEGALDETFGFNGKVTTDFSGFDAAHGIVINPDGEIFVVGVDADPRTGSDFGIARYVEPIADPGFGLSRATYNVSRYEKRSIKIYVTRLAGFDGEVTVTAPDSTDEGIAVTPTTRSTGGSKVKFKIKILASAIEGDHTLVFTGRDATGHERQARLILSVQ